MQRLGARSHAEPHGLAPGCHDFRFRMVRLEGKRMSKVLVALHEASMQFDAMHLVRAMDLKRTEVDKPSRIL